MILTACRDFCAAHFELADGSATVGSVLRTGKILAWTLATFYGVLAWGCATTTEFQYEGPGWPSDRAKGTVPEGMLGVCRVANTTRPVLVDERLWEHARTCTPNTPARFIRLGFAPTASMNEADASREQEKYLAALRDGAKSEGGNIQLVSLIRALHERGLRDPLLHNRVSRQTTKDGVCDYSYLLNTMASQHERLAKGDKCTAHAYDTAARAEVCLFDTARPEGVWLTSSWSCVAHTGALGEAESCYRLCGYDDYCAKHVSCSEPDVDLLLCALGVCVPEPRAGGL